MKEMKKLECETPNDNVPATFNRFKIVEGDGQFEGKVPQSQSTEKNILTVIRPSCDP